MENNQLNHNSIANQSTISNTRKMTIIKLMLQFGNGKDFSVNKERLQSFRSTTEEDITFINEVYELLQEIELDSQIPESEYRIALEEELYRRLEIPEEFLQEERKKAEERRENISRELNAQRQLWSKQDGETEEKYERKNTVEPDQRENGEEVVDYKEDLYQPETLCGKASKMSKKPYVEHIRYTEDRIADISPKTSYQFSERTYTIRKVGELLYMPTPNLKDSLSEYEITISRDDISKTINVFGEISLNRMSDPYYSATVFLQLLGVTNLTDRKLQGYIGSLEQVRDKSGDLKNEYKMIHSPEEYTAVVVWKQIEQIKGERKIPQQNELPRNEEKVAGGEDR